MPERQIPKLSLQRIEVPAVQPTGLPNLISNVSNYFSTLALESRKEWVKAEIKKAEREGRIEGTLDTVQYRKSGTLTAEAFNQEALKGQLKNLELVNNLTFEKLKVSEAGNPESFLQKTNAYIEETVNKLREDAVTFPSAEFIENTLRLKQLTYGHEISKQYKEVLKDQTTVTTESLIHNLETEAYSQGRNIYSKDEELAAITWNNFAMAKKALDVQLNTTVDGEKLYKASEKEEIRRNFHRNFYIKSLQHYISDNDLEPEEEIKLLQGTFTVKVPGTDLIVNPLNEIGVKQYDSKIKIFVQQKARERILLTRKQEEQERNQLKIMQDVAGYRLISDIKSRNPERVITVDTINEMVSTGETSPMWGLKGINTLTSESPLLDDSEVVLIVNRMIMDEEDASDYLNSVADRLTDKTYLELLKANDRALSDLANRELKAFHKQFVVRDIAFGTTRESERDFNDIAATFREDLDKGMTMELAVQKMRMTGDFIRAADRDIQYERLTYIITFTPEGKLDYKSTLSNLKLAVDFGKFTSIEYRDYLRALDEISQPPVLGDIDVKL